MASLGLWGVGEYAQAAEYVAEQRVESERQSLVAASFTAWQLGAGQKKSFGEYLRSLGLHEREKPMSATEKAAVVSRALSTAARISRLDRATQRRRKRVRHA